MCDITIENFESKYNEIVKNLNDSNFVAIDCEFSGLHLDNAQPSIVDNGHQRYKKLKKSIQLFNLVQIGLSTFQYCTSQKSFLVDTYNFYLFPRNYGILNGDPLNTLQTSSIEFLCKYDFDFNKLIYKGIPYMNKKQEKMIEEKLTRLVTRSDLNARNIDDRQLQKVCCDVADWLVKSKVGDHMEINSFKDLPDYIIHNELRERFDSIWTYQLNNQIQIERVSQEKRTEYEKNSRSEIKQMIDNLLGFTKIFRQLIQSKKPIVVHNGFMDLMFIHEKFYDTCPDTLDEFKKSISQLFPLIYDTKHISIECKKLDTRMKELYDNTTLEVLYSVLNREVAKRYALFLIPIKSRNANSIYSIKQLPHEAGYDSCMTGTVFLRLAHVLTTLDTKKCFNAKPNNINEFFIITRPFLNRVKLIKASIDHLNLSGPDPKDSTTKYLFVKCKQPYLKYLSPTDLLAALSPYGQSEIVMKSRKTACIAVDTYNSAASIIERFAQSKEYDISVYNRWSHSPLLTNMLGGSIILASGLLTYFLFSKRATIH